MVATYLKAGLRWVRGPAGGALYDLDDGRVIPVAAAFAEAVDRHVADGSDLAAQLHGSTAAAWLETLRQDGLLQATPPGSRPPLALTQPNAPKLIWFELTGRCNYTCIHCYADSDPTPTPTMPDERWFALIAEARAAGFPAIQFTGGDPLMHPRLADFVAAAHDQGFETVEVYTNGAMLQPRHIDLFARRGTHVAMSFYSYDAATYEAIVQQPKGHARAVASIRALIERGVPLRIGLIEMEQNREHVPDTIAFLEDLGVARERIHVDAVRPQGRGTELAAAGCGAGKTAGAAFVPLAQLDGETAPPPIWHSPMPLPRHFKRHGDGAAWNACWAGELVVDPEGAVYPCIFTRDRPLAQVADTPLGDALDVPEVADAWDTNLGDADDCSVCAYRFACFDCRALTVNVTGRRNAKPPSCIYDPHHDRFDWSRWLRQIGDPGPVAAATGVYGAGSTQVLAEDDHGVTVAAADGHAMAVLDFLPAVVLENADGRSAAALAEQIASVRGEPVTKWLGPALMAAWELEQRGLVDLAAP